MFSVWARQQPGRGLGALSFNMNKAAYYVGEAPTYNLSGGAAYSPVLWSSMKNGESTGEVLTDYGHRTDGNGNLTGAGGVWTADQIGAW